jgi:hypothetical protein
MSCKPGEATISTKTPATFSAPEGFLTFPEGLLRCWTTDTEALVTLAVVLICNVVVLVETAAVPLSVIVTVCLQNVAVLVVVLPALSVAVAFIE